MGKGLSQYLANQQFGLCYVGRLLPNWELQPGEAHRSRQDGAGAGSWLGSEGAQVTTRADGHFSP